MKDYQKQFEKESGYKRIVRISGSSYVDYTWKAPLNMGTTETEYYIAKSEWLEKNLDDRDQTIVAKDLTIKAKDIQIDFLKNIK